MGSQLPNCAAKFRWRKESEKGNCGLNVLLPYLGCTNGRCPPTVLGGTGFKVCSAVSYFSTRVGSIIGAGRLSFRVRDGSGRFPAAMDRRNCIHSFLSAPLFLWGEVCGPRVLVVGCGHWLFDRVVWLRGFVVVVSFRPVSASSLRLLLGV